MPRLDDLFFTNDDSDHESFSSELSPTDGYFNRRPQQSSPRGMLPEQSSEDSKPEGKVLIPTPKNQSSAGRSSRTSLGSLLPLPVPRQNNYASEQPSASASSSSPRLPTTSHQPPFSTMAPRAEIYSEQYPLINGPPPAYLPNPDNPVRCPEPENRESYSSFSEHHLESGRPPDHEPESMATPGNEPNERSPLWGRPVKYVRASPHRKAVKKLLFLALVVAVVFTLLMGTSHSLGRGPPNLPGKGASYFCSLTKVKKDQLLYLFPNNSDIGIIHTTHSDSNDHHNPVSIKGEIRLQRIPKDSKNAPGGYFTVDMSLSDPGLDILLKMDEEKHTLSISTPSSTKLPNPGPFTRHCISLEIIAWVPENGVFNNLLIQSTSLSLKVKEDVKIDVIGESRFETKSGDIQFFGSTPVVFESVGKSVVAVPAKRENLKPNSVAVVSSSGQQSTFNSRRVVVETYSGSIEGCYPLLDYLGITSKSGSVKVSIDPKPENHEDPKSAELAIKTYSGSIQANLPIKNHTPGPIYKYIARNYITTVGTLSGSIQGTYYIGVSSFFKTNSGSIQVLGLPFIGEEEYIMDGMKYKNRLDTSSHSGSTAVRLLEPIFLTRSTTTSSTVIDGMNSTHSSYSGQIVLDYPSAWIGGIHGKTNSGSVKISGEGVKVIEDRKIHGKREVWAKKGVQNLEDGSTVLMLSTSGSQSLLVGPEGWEANGRGGVVVEVVEINEMDLEW